MKNMEQLRDEQIQIFDELRSHKIGLNEAKVLSNVAGKIISSVKTQIEYNKMTGNNTSSIKFMKGAH